MGKISLNTGDLKTGLKERDRRVVVNGIGVQRTDDAQVIGHVFQVRH